MKILKKKLLLVIMLGIGKLGYSQCDSTLVAKEGTYNVRVIQESVDYIGLIPRQLTCEELMYIEEIRSNEKIILKLDNYTEVEILPKKHLYYEK